jgi:hypothetical protein
MIGHIERSLAPILNGLFRLVPIAWVESLTTVFQHGSKGFFGCKVLHEEICVFEDLEIDGAEKVVVIY